MQPTAETPLLAEEKYKDEEAKPTKAMLGEKDELSRLPDDVLESLSPFLLVKEARKLSIVDHNLYDRITNLTLFSSSFAHEEKKIKLQLAEQSLKRIEQNRREMYSRRRMYISFFPLSMACLPCLIHDRFFIFGPLNEKLSIVDHNLYDRITNLTLFSSSFAHEEKKIKLQLAEQSLKRIEQNRREMYSRRRMYISFFPLSMACLPCLIHDRFFIFGPLNEFQRFQQRYPQDYQNIKSILPDNSENSLTFMQVRRSLQILKEEIRQSGSLGK